MTDQVSKTSPDIVVRLRTFAGVPMARSVEERAMAEAADEIERLEDRVRLLETAIEAVPADPAIGEWWDQFGDLLGEIHQGVAP